MPGTFYKDPGSGASKARGAYLIVLKQLGVDHIAVHSGCLHVASPGDILDY